MNQINFSWDYNSMTQQSIVDDEARDIALTCQRGNSWKYIW